MLNLSRSSDSHMGISMDEDAENFEALAEATVFLSYFKELPDHRQAGKVTYPLDEILLLCLLAVLAGAEAFTDIARFGEKKLELLRRFRPYRNGTPAHDHLGDIFATLDAGVFQRCFVAWVSALTKTPAEVIAIDGDRRRRRHHRRNGMSAKHRQEDHRQKGRLTHRAQGQSGDPARRRKSFRRRAESRWFQGYDDQPARNGRWGSRAYRNQNLHRDPRCRMVGRTP